jgi:hypothetical protein
MLYETAIMKYVAQIAKLYLNYNVYNLNIEDNIFI